MSRYIDADALIADLDKGLWGKDYDKALAEAIIQDAPSIDIDLAEDGTLSVEVEDATKVKRVLVEDGKNGDLYYADRPQGEWVDAEIPLESGGSMPIQVCNLCKTFYPLAYTGGGHRFCPNCGARMKGADNGEDVQSTDE